MNFNYKAAFFITLAVWIVTGFLFLTYIIFTTIVFFDAGKSKLITNECADGDYCADNPVNMPKGGWTGMDNNGIAPSTPEDKVSANNLYQNTDFRFRFDLKEGDDVLTCPTDGETYIYVQLNPNQACDDADGPRNYIAATKGPEDYDLEVLRMYYDFETSVFRIGEMSGKRYIGTWKTSRSEKPLPEDEQIDFVLINNSDIYYQISSDFYDRNVYIY